VKGLAARRNPKEKRSASREGVAVFTPKWFGVKEIRDKNRKGNFIFITRITV